MLTAMFALAAIQARQVIGIHETWGAFEAAAPRRCFAMSAPVQRRRQGFVAISYWPGADGRGQVHVRLSRPRAARAQVTLTTGGRRFRLTAGPRDAWAPDAAADRAIVAAMRGGRSLSVETLAANGGAFADVYRLAGAATAIDAAGVRCAR